jgi:hypothetical protein
MRSIVDDIELEFIRRYLLGELDDAGREKFEQRIISDPEYQDAVLMVEDELIEDFVAGALSEGERLRFIKHFLSTTRQRHRLKDIQGLHAYFEREAVAETTPEAGKPERQRLWQGLAGRLLPASRLSLAAAASLVVLAGVVLLLIVRYASGPSEMSWSASFREDWVRLNDPKAPPATQSPSSFQITLMAMHTRSSGEMPKVVPPPGADSMQAELRLPPGQSTSYRVTLRAIDGGASFPLPPLPPQTINGNRVLLLNVPVRRLPRGDYELQLTGVGDESAASNPVTYYFRLIR